MSKTIIANGIEVNYSLEGSAAKPVIMFSNSLLTNYHMWDWQIPAFADRYRILRYDTRGHGNTQATSGIYTMDLLVTDVVALLDKLGIDKVHFVGLSMGGMIAQLVAAKHGRRLLSVTLCDTACRMPPESIWDDRIALARAKGTMAFVRPMTERWLTKAYLARNQPVVEQLGNMISRTSIDGFIGCAHAIKNMDHLAVLADVRVPTLVIVGEFDSGTPLSAAEVLHRKIKHSRLSIIKQAAHLPNIEQSDVFNDTLTTFLDSVN